MRVHVTDLRAGDQLSEDIFNLYGLHVLSSGTILNERELSRLYQHQIDYVEIERRQQPLDKPAPYVHPKLLPRYEDAVAGCELLFRRAIEEGTIREEDVNESFEPLMNHFREERDVVSLLLLLNSQDDYTYQHSVQVGMLSYYIAKWVGWNEEDRIRAGTAGFLHDIGKCRISEEILNKPDKLTEEEFEMIKRHPQYGYEILSEAYPDSDIATAALQHHERKDGRGYPNQLTGEEIHPISRVVAIADVYSAMTSSRVYQEKRDLLYVLKELYRLSFEELDAEMTHAFIRHMIPNFIGKQVELTNGERGTIILSNESDWFRPLIRIDDRFIDLSVHREYEIKHVYM